MTGAAAAYGMTNYWDSMDMQKEIQQGKNLADAAKETSVDHYIWGSLYNIKERKLTLADGSPIDSFSCLPPSRTRSSLGIPRVGGQ
jgi:hypothetical protein